MKKKIIITEKQEEKLLEFLITEQTFPVEPNKVLLVKNFLDKNFKKGTLNQFDDNGMIKNIPVAGMILNGEVVKNLTKKQLFNMIEHEFRGMFSNKIQRSKFLAQVIEDWFSNKISKEGLLSKTHC